MRRKGLSVTALLNIQEVWIIPSQLDQAIIVTFIISLVVAGFAGTALAQSPILPNGIKFVGDQDTLAPGAPYSVSMQITLDGGPLKSEGIRVYVRSSDDSVISAPPGTYVLTDATGKATYNFTTGNKTGTVTLTADALNINGGITTTKKFTIGSYGAVSGLIVDVSNTGISNASVTLYSSNGSAKGPQAQAPNNPQVSGSDGSYRFDKLPLGTYYIEAKKDNATGFSIYNLTSSNATLTIQLEGYNATPSIIPTPSPSANATATAQPTEMPSVTPTAEPTAAPTAAPTATPEPANEQQAIGIIVAGLALAVVILVSVLIYRSMGKK